MSKWFDKFAAPFRRKQRNSSYLRQLVSGSLYRLSDIKNSDALASIQNVVQAMRELAEDSQVATALSYYATDATTPNTSGDIIWATSVDGKHTDAADIVNSLFKRWDINRYARDHILELATIGNLYIPTTDMFKLEGTDRSSVKIALDNNTIPDLGFDVVPSYKIDPEELLHLWKQGQPEGFIYQPLDTNNLRTNTQLVRYPESSIIHFSLGGLLGEYSIDVRDSNGDIDTYDVQFATPLLKSAVSPTQTLNLLENASILSSLVKVVRFIAVDCGNAEDEEIQMTLQEIKDAIQQQLSLNTSNGDSQSFLNPSSPNNLIYLPKVNGANPIDIIDLDMRDSSDTDDKLLNYYQDKKLSVLGIPKEALNFSSSEGLGGAGAVMSQRSALYANSLQRLETAYISGWKDAMNKYFRSKNMTGFVDQFQLHMNPILTEMSTVQFEKRDSALGQATTLVELFQGLNVDNKDMYIQALVEILTEAFPQTSSSLKSSMIDVEKSEDDMM